MIATLAEVKNILGISDTSLDTRIQALMPSVQSDIIDFCRNDFAIRDLNHSSDSITFTASGKKITDLGGGFVDEARMTGSKDVVVTYSFHNNKHYTVDTISDTEIVVDEDIIDETNEDGILITVRTVIYPLGLDVIFATMINTKIFLDEMNGGGVKSKKLETFSVTFTTENLEAGYFKTDWEALRKYRKLYKG